jgi:hypothetical protein
VTVIPPKARLGGVPEVPEDDGEILNFAHKHGDRNCRCLRCTCKLCADPEGLTLCGRSEDEKCPICRIINKFVVKQTKELKDEYEETIASMKASHLVDIEKMKQSHKVEVSLDNIPARIMPRTILTVPKLQDAMQANNDLDKGLLEARRGEIAQQRKEREKAEKREGMEARIAEIKTALEEKGKAAKVATQTLGERRIVLNNLKRDNLNARRGTGDMGWVDNAKYQQKKNRKHASDT